MSEHNRRNVTFIDFLPGTGKTTVARKIGQVFYDMGVLGSAEVVECSSSDLVGQYVGQTGPKTKKLFEKALGKVLFIDEAYRLAEGHFAQEAIDELVGLLTHASFKSKLIVVLAGYEQDMNRLLSVNTGLSSRFPDQVVFRDMDAERCIIVLKAELQKEGVSVIGFDDTSSTYIDIKELIRDIAELKDWGNARDMMTLSKEMIGYALRSSNSTAGALEISGEEAVDVVKKMLQDRQRRTNITNNHRRSRFPNLPQQSFTPNPPTPPSTSTAENTATAQPPPPPPPPPPPATQEPPRMPTPQPRSPRGRGQNATRGSRDRNRNNRHDPAHTGDSSDNSGAAGQPRVDDQHPQSPAPQGQGQNTARGGRHRNNRNDPARTGGGSDNSRAARQPQIDIQHPQSPASPGQPSQPARDPGVSDALWRHMEAAKRAAAQIERDAQNSIKRLARELAEKRKQEDAEKKRIQDLQRAEAQARDAAHRAELQRQQEEARLKEVAARAAREKAAAEHQARQEAERQRKEREARTQQRLRELGVCPAGYQWIKMGSMYRCQGGAHLVAESELGL